VVAPVVRVTWDEVAELPETARGKGGFGHSGV
jgi:dUTP pyrophosphatase